MQNHGKQLTLRSSIRVNQWAGNLIHIHVVRLTFTLLLWWSLAVGLWGLLLLGSILLWLWGWVCWDSWLWLGHAVRRIGESAEEKSREAGRMSVKSCHKSWVYRRTVTQKGRGRLESLGLSGRDFSASWPRLSPCDGVSDLGRPEPLPCPCPI